MKVSGHRHTPAALPQRNSPRYPLDMRLGGLQSWSGRYGGKRNLFSLPEIEPWSSSLQPSSYTDWAVSEAFLNLFFILIYYLRCCMESWQSSCSFKFLLYWRVLALLAACFMLVSWLDFSSTLKTEATCSSETPLDLQWARRCCLAVRTSHVSILFSKLCY
jgi:hypothetical protein